VTLHDGTSVPADAVVVGVGITPAVDITQAAGLAVHNGVLVDAALRTSDPDIYAAGDVANAYNPLLATRISAASTGVRASVACPASCSGRPITVSSPPVVAPHPRCDHGWSTDQARSGGGGAAN
jgi:3-phenylpropionate/trans-cinnamate dioxygenase ferredoxin reductase subunit